MCAYFLLVAKKTDCKIFFFFRFLLLRLFFLNTPTSPPPNINVLGVETVFRSLGVGDDVFFFFFREADVALGHFFVVDVLKNLLLVRLTVLRFSACCLCTRVRVSFLAGHPFADLAVSAQLRRTRFLPKVVEKRERENSKSTLKDKEECFALGKGPQNTFASNGFFLFVFCFLCFLLCFSRSFRPLRPKS